MDPPAGTTLHQWRRACTPSSPKDPELVEVPSVRSRGVDAPATATPRGARVQAVTDKATGYLPGFVYLQSLGGVTWRPKGATITLTLI